MSATDELREWVRNRVAEFSIGGICGNDLNTIADRIDVEYAAYRAAVAAMPKEYVKLPVDADGVPIHLGDEIQYGKVIDTVDCLSLSKSGWHIDTEYDDFDNKRIKGYELELLDHPELFRHVQPDSWEGIIADAMLGAERDGAPDTYSDCLAELVERCMRLAGEAE